MRGGVLEGLNIIPMKKCSRNMWGIGAGAYLWDSACSIGAGAYPWDSACIGAGAYPWDSACSEHYRR